MAAIFNNGDFLDSIRSDGPSFLAIPLLPVCSAGSRAFLAADVFFRPRPVFQGYPVGELLNFLPIC
jgi:hypothetical protein